MSSIHAVFGRLSLQGGDGDGEVHWHGYRLPAEGSLVCCLLSNKISSNIYNYNTCFIIPYTKIVS